jgi:LysR family nitrogen assimilation transcriptional regulator
METRALRYFQAVAEFGSYSRAAEFLRISQPAVSRQIRTLETSLGRKLFLRQSHGVSLTEAGRALLERARLILRQFDQTEEEIRRGQVQASGTITLGVPPAAGNMLVPELTRRLSAAFPNVFLHVVAGFSVYLQEWMARGRVDVACLHDPVPRPGFAITPLVREEVFLVGRRGALEMPGGHVRIQQLAGLPLILPAQPNASRRLLDGWLARRGIRLNVRMEVDDHMIIRALLREGLGFSLLTQGAFLADLPLGTLEAWPMRPRAFWGLSLMQQPPERQTEIAAALAAMIPVITRDLVREGRWPGAVLVEGSGRRV